MKNPKILIALTVMLIVGLSFLCLASAQSRVPGVSVGDSFTYTFDFQFDVSDSSFDLPSLFEGLVAEVENIDSVTASVTQVSGSTVTLQTVMQFKNGTQQTGMGTIDVATGQDTTQESSIGMFLIASNLNANDPIYTEGNSGIINETITKQYPSGSRQVNHQNIVMDYDVSQEELSGFGIDSPLQQSNTQNIYWDRQTGALVQMTYNMTTRSSEVNADISVNIELVESSVFVIPEYPSAVIIVVLVLAVSALAMLTVRSRSQK